MKATHEFIHGNTHIARRSNSISRRNFGKELNQIWRGFVTFLAGSSEPKIQRLGEDNWRVYDPQSDRSLSFSSEQEVRVWLDQRYSF